MSLTWPEASWLKSALILAVAALASCTGFDSPQLGSSSAAVAGRNDNGTELFAGTAQVVDQTCNGDTGSVTIEGTLTTTGSVDSAEIEATINGGATTVVGTIEPEDFVHDGRVKTASYSITIDLPEGTNTVSICFDQSGSQGREPKYTCAETLIVVVDCASDCRGTGFFGDLPGNPSLCRGNGPPHIPVHVKGDLGDAPALTITGPNGYTHSATMNHAGESCVYQYNWDTAGNGGAGLYTFTVTGGGNTYSFTATLRCPNEAGPQDVRPQQAPRSRLYTDWDWAPAANQFSPAYEQR
jgi:hypothetical protein